MWFKKKKTVFCLAIKECSAQKFLRLKNKKTKTKCCSSMDPLSRVNISHCLFTSPYLVSGPVLLFVQKKEKKNRKEESLKRFKIFLKNVTLWLCREAVMYRKSRLGKTQTSVFTLCTSEEDRSHRIKTNKWKKKHVMYFVIVDRRHVYLDCLNKCE